MFLENLCEYLARQPLIRVVGTAKDAAEALEKAKALHPDLVLMDVNLPQVEGTEAATILRSHLPQVRVILMSLEDSARIRKLARQHGAHGFVGKGSITNDLLKEIRRVFQVKDENEKGGP